VEYVVIAVVAVLLVVAIVVLIRAPRRGPRTMPAEQPRAGVDYKPGVGDDAAPPVDTATRDLQTIPLPDEATIEEARRLPTLPERPEPTAGRLVRLRSRLARSQSALGRGLLTLLSRERLDEDTWDEIEDTLITSDLGVAPARELVGRLRNRVRVEGVADPAAAHRLLREELVALVDPTMDRSLHTARHVADNRPAVVLVVGVNGTGKTTTVG
jgi:fused signal recognition particle receptor